MNRIDLILLTQPFASPTDMASSGVKENVILTTTPHIGWCMWNVIIYNFEFGCLTKMDNNHDFECCLPTF